MPLSPVQPQLCAQQPIAGACQPASNPPVAPFLRILEPALPALPAPTCSVFRRPGVLCATCTLQFSVNTDALTSCRSPTAPNSLSCNAPAPPLATGCAAPSSVAQQPDLGILFAWHSAPPPASKEFRALQWKEGSALGTVRAVQNVKSRVERLALQREGGGGGAVT